MGPQRVGRKLAAEQQQQSLVSCCYLHVSLSITHLLQNTSYKLSQFCTEVSLLNQNLILGFLKIDKCLMIWSFSMGR